MNILLGNRIFLLFIMLVLAAFAFQFQPIPEEAKTYPFVLLIISYIISIYLFIRPMASGKRNRKEILNISRNVAVFALSILLYIFFINKISYFLATLLFTVLVLFFAGIRTKKILILLPLVLTFLVYLFFTKILGVFLPEGTWIQIYF